MEAEEAELEQQLQEHLIEHKESLSAIEEALAGDPTNQELFEVKEELCAALKSAEESLLQLKRNRLLREIDSALEAKDTEIKSKPPLVSKDMSIEPQVGHGSPFLVGAKCRFRHGDGRWYYGQIIEIASEGLARVSFLTPTREKMQMCKFYMQQRCRFGEACRMSHGNVVSLEALRKYDSSRWLQPCIGSAVLACSSSTGEGLWRSAELESWDESLQSGTAVFVDDGTHLVVGMENLSLSEYAKVTDTEGSSSEEEEEEEVSEEVEDDDEDGDNAYSVLGLGVMGMPETGPQTDTRLFANWEKHTRGVASKMMANMGYQEGMGLGKAGQGRLAPLRVRVLPKHQSLDFIGKEDDNDQEKDKKKKSRGGKRKRDRKHADATRAAKAEGGQSLDVFGFINNQLSTQKDLQGETTEAGKRFYEGKMGSQRQVKAQKEDRRSLMVQANEVAELRSKVEKLEEMAVRNEKDKAFHEAITRRLHEARKDLHDAETNHASSSLAMQSKEKEKRWLKF